MKYNSFSDMPVWQKAHELSVEVFELTITMPKSEDYGLKSQIRRSANSVSANIAEAFGRNTKKDKANFYVVARGTAYETQNHLIYGNRVGYFKNENTNILIEHYHSLIYETNKIIKTLKD
jgi:four helix bundle protein